MELRHFRCYFGYDQIIIWDDAERNPGVLWTDGHVAQGFARRESTLSVGMLDEDGLARVNVHVGSYAPASHYKRVVAVPFEAPTGQIRISGPAEANDPHCVELEPGHYLVTAALSGNPSDEFTDTKSEQLTVDLFFDKRAWPAVNSAILLADDQLNPPSQLLETAEYATNDPR